MALNDLTGQNIQDTYQKVVQTDGTSLADGTGSLLPISFDGNDVTISGSLTANEYVVSSSVTNITIATLSGSTTFGDSADDTHQFTGSILVTGSVDLTGNITASGDISSSGDLIASSSLTLNAPISRINFTDKLRIVNLTSNDYLQIQNDSMKFIIGGSEAMVLRDSNDDIQIGYGGIDTVIIGSSLYSMYTANMDTQTNSFKYKTYFHEGGFAGMADTGAIVNVSGSVNVLGGHITSSGNISASGYISAYGSSSLNGLPTSVPSTTGSLWVSGSNAEGTSKYLMVFTG